MHNSPEVLLVTAIIVAVALTAISIVALIVMGRRGGRLKGEYQHSADRRASLEVELPTEDQIADQRRVRASGRGQTDKANVT